MADENLMLAQAGAAGGTGPVSTMSASDIGTVWWGATVMGKNWRPPNEKVYGPGIETTDNGAAMGLAMLWDTGARTRIYQTAVRFGAISPQTAVGASTLDTLWKKALTFSAEAWKNGQRVTPWEALRFMSARADGGSGGSGAAAPFTGTRTTTSTNLTLTDPKTARALARAVLQDQLGRAPSEEEYDQLVGALRGAERKSPTVSTTATTYKAGEQVSSSTKTRGGLDSLGKQESIEERIDGDEELSDEKRAQQRASYVELIMQMAGGA